MKSLKRAAFALLIPAAALLAGCGGEDKKTVASVNGDKITEEEFNSRVVNVGLPDLLPSYQQSGRLQKAGEFAMRSLVNEKLLAQLAKEKNVLPSEADVNAMVPLAKKWQSIPQAVGLNPDPSRTDADWRRDVRIALMQRNLAMAPLKISEDEIKKEYEAVKTQLTPPDQYRLGMIMLSSNDKAQKALSALKSNVAFETVALTQSEDPASRPRQGDVGWQPATALPKELLDVVKTLKPGEYAKKVVAVKQPAGQNPSGQTAYLIPKLLEMKPGTPPTLDEARPIVINQLIGRKDPSASQRVGEDFRKFMDKAKVEVTLKPYDKLFDKTAQPAPGTPGAPGGVPGDAPGSAPGMPPGATPSAPPGPAAGTPGG